jgi:iron(III) transport system substrate-binding protein
MRVSLQRAGVAAVALVLTVASCGGSPSSGDDEAESGPTAAEKVYAEINTMTGKERRDRLVELAGEEGSLDLYTSMTADVADAVSEAFTDTFDIDVNVYRASSETVLQRILQEQAANFAGNDVVETNATELFALAEEGRLAEYAGERRDMVPEAGRFDLWTATRFNLFAPSWNTKLVPKGQQPTSWEDLADPKWDGKLSMEVADYDWYLTLYGYWQQQGKSEAEIDKLFSDMANGAKVASGHTVQAELMSAGQFALVASNYTYIVQRAKDDGAPVDYQPLVEPVIARPNGVGLMKSAKHPAAAMLFADWLLEEGQQVLVDEQLTPSIPTGEDPLADVEIIPVNIEELVDRGKEWSERYDKVVASGEKVSD